MKIHGLSLVKNEADIIVQSLSSAAEWCDFIYVFDNGSTDSTWEKVLGVASKNDRIIPFKQDSADFHDGLRGEIFNQYKNNSEEGDWWCRLDADEFYIDDPRIFLSKIPEPYELVCSASFGFYFTDADLKAYEQDPARYAESVPVEEKITYYSNRWSEIRCVKHVKDMAWPLDSAWPVSNRNIYPIRIWTKNYRYRSPEQMQSRIETRRNAMERGGFVHELASRNYWKEKNRVDPTGAIIENKLIDPNLISWKDRVADSKSLYHYQFDGKYFCNESLMPSVEEIERYIENKIVTQSKDKQKLPLLLKRIHSIRSKLRHLNAPG